MLVVNNKNGASGEGTILAETQAELRQGVQAYKNGDFNEAIRLLQIALSADPWDWHAKLYLAMCFARADRVDEAKTAFHVIQQECPHPELRMRARTAITALNRVSGNRAS